MRKLDGNPFDLLS